MPAAIDQVPFHTGSTGYDEPICSRGGEIIIQRCERNIGLPSVGKGPVKHAEMWDALAIVGNECLYPEPGSVGRGEVEPSLDVTAGRHWTLKITAERRAETPARLEIGGIEEAL